MIINVITLCNYIRESYVFMGGVKGDWDFQISDLVKKP